MSVQPSPTPVEEASRPKPATPSGRLLLRMSPGLHAELARKAESEGASLNGYIIARLTESVGWTSSGESAPARASTPSSDSPSPTLTRLLLANVVAVALAAVAAVAILLVAWLG